MGIVSTVIKKGELLTGTDEKKLLTNMNTRIEELKLQNAENAKILKAMCKRMEAENAEYQKSEENKSVQIMEQSIVIDKIDKVQQSIEEINQDQVIMELAKVNDKITLNASEINEEIAGINEAVAGINSNEVLSAIASLDQSIKELSTKEVEEKLETVRESVENINGNQLHRALQEIDQGIKKANNDQLLAEVGKLNTLISKIDSTELTTEIRKINIRINNINSLNITAELEKISKAIEDMDYNQLMTLIENAEKEIKAVKDKMDIVYSIPAKIAAMQKEESLSFINKLEEYMKAFDLNEHRRNKKMKLLLAANLWLSLLTVAIIIASVLGII